MSRITRIQKNPWVLVPLAFGIVGIIVFVIGARGALTLVWLRSHGVEAEGTVVDVRSYTTGKGSRVKASIRFQAQDGETITFEAGAGQYAPRYARGEKVPVLYNPDNPDRARVGTRDRLPWKDSYMLMGIGGVFIAIGGVLLWKLLTTNVAPVVQQ
jgi:hypothetical protein